MIEVINTLVSFAVCLLMVALVTNKALRDKTPLLREKWFRGAIVLLAAGSLLNAVGDNSPASLLLINIGLIGLTYWMYSLYVSQPYK